MILDKITEEDLALLTKWASDNDNTIAYKDHIESIVILDIESAKQFYAKQQSDSAPAAVPIDGGV